MSRLTLQSYQTNDMTIVQNVEKARVRNDIAVVKRIGSGSVDLTDRRILTELKDMRDAKVLENDLLCVKIS